MIPVRVLLVDDEPEVIDAVSRDLRAWCREDAIALSVARSSKEALDTMRDTGEFAVVVTDVKMPGLKGNDLLSLIQQRHPTTVTLVLTGHSGHEYVRDYLEAGLFMLVEKPWDKATLVNEMKRAVREWKARCEVRVALEEAKQERSLARQFGDVLHRQPLPEVPGVVVDVAHETGGVDDLGGDFVAVERHGERLLVMLADLNGSLTSTAYLLGWLRGALAQPSAGPFAFDGLLAGLEAQRDLCALPGDAPSVCLVLAEVDPQRGRMRWINRGQPALLLDLGQGSIAVPSVDGAELECPLPQGAVLRLTSDGVFGSGTSQSALTEGLERGEPAKATLQRWKAYATSGGDRTLVRVELRST